MNPWAFNGGFKKEKKYDYKKYESHPRIHPTNSAPKANTARVANANAPGTNR